MKQPARVIIDLPDGTLQEYRLISLQHTIADGLVTIHVHADGHDGTWTGFASAMDWRGLHRLCDQLGQPVPLTQKKLRRAVYRREP